MRNISIPPLSHPPGPVLDIGAHAGEFSLMASKLGRTVYAVEPDPDALVWNAEEEITFSLAAS